MRTHNRRFLAPLIALVIGLLLLAGCAGALSEVRGASPAGATGVQSPANGILTGNQAQGGAATPSAGVGQADLLPNIAAVVEQVAPTVVTVQARISRFGGFDGQAGEGTGFIIDDQGHVVTNAHVVGDADRVTVVLLDGRQFEDVRVVGRDPVSDLAVVKVNSDDLPVAQLGSSDALRRGQWVVAIGNALGFGQSVTAGVVSAFDRVVNEPNGCRLDNMIQTDAAINPGNSGGPLFDMTGRVVGINTAVQRATTSGVPVEGVGFAIPIDKARPIIEDLVADGVVEGVVRPYMGVRLVQNDPSIAARFNLPTDTGVLVFEVVPDGPAARAGLQEGSVVFEANGERVGAPEDITNVIANLQVGDGIALSGLTFQGQSFQVTVTLGQYPRTC